MNRIEKGLKDWQQRQDRYAALFGAPALQSRAFAKIRLSEMQQLYRRSQPPRNGDERVSLKMLRAANRNLEKSIYPNRIFRAARNIFKFTVGTVTGFVKSVAAMMQDNPAAFIEVPTRKPKEAKPTLAKEQKIQHPNVVRMQPRKHQAPGEEPKKSRGLSR